MQSDNSTGAKKNELSYPNNNTIEINSGEIIEKITDMIQKVFKVAKEHFSDDVFNSIDEEIRQSKLPLDEKNKLRRENEEERRKSNMEVLESVVGGAKDIMLVGATLTVVLAIVKGGNKHGVRLLTNVMRRTRKGA